MKPIRQVIIAFAVSFIAASMQAQTVQLRQAVFCSGAAALNNGSFITLGQPFFGSCSGSGGTVKLTAGFQGVSHGIAVAPGNPWIGTPGLQAGGQFRFQYQGLIGRNIVIEASTNLQHWTPIRTNVGVPGMTEFADPDSFRFHQRFYRVKAEQP